MGENMSENMQHVPKQIRKKPPRYQPKTALGARLMAIREKAIAKGLPLLNAEEIAEEIRQRRGKID
jgi:hypothetical protein